MDTLTSKRWNIATDSAHFCGPGAGFTLVVPLVGLILGFVGIRKESAGRGMAITGLILNGIIIAGWVILFLIMLLAGIGIFGAAATSGSTTGY